MGRKRKPKAGVCTLFPRGKVRYRSVAVAEYDRQVMQARYPDDTFEAFRCDCGHWHVGRAR